MMKDKDSLRLLFWFVFGVAFVALMFGLTSCKTQKQIQTEYIYIDRTDTVMQVKWRVDSINVYDSIVTFIKGDTVITDRWHTSYKDRLRIDTVEKLKTEVIYETKTEVKTEIRETHRLYWWQTAFIWIGAIAFVFIILWIVDKLYRKR